MKPKLLEYEHATYLGKWLRTIGDLRKSDRERFMSFVRDTLDIARAEGHVNLVEDYQARFVQLV